MENKEGYIVSVWKRPDWTSNDIIKYLKPFIRPLKVGHAGTLDPFAEGILVVCTGKMTKKVSTIMEMEKEYVVDIVLGKRTDTLDSTGKITARKKCPSLNVKIIDKVLNQFIGEIDQIPPMFSALKHKGKRMYSLARKGIKIKQNPRKIIIHSIELLSYKDNFISIKVICGKGTYIRSLARDIGHKLNTEGYVDSLVRSRVGSFDRLASISAEDLKLWLQSQQHITN
ncbi:tRNA pseudouridine(55) synthase TruB [bacterium]|nr:MAG: tRNA pseudouridine(55) synthase TruB [bacterium]